MLAKGCDQGGQVPKISANERHRLVELASEKGLAGFRVQEYDSLATCQRDPGEGRSDEARTCDQSRHGRTLSCRFRARKESKKVSRGRGHNRDAIAFGAQGAGKDPSPRGLEAELAGRGDSGLPLGKITRPNGIALEPLTPTEAGKMMSQSLLKPSHPTPVVAVLLPAVDA